MTRRSFQFATTLTINNDNRSFHGAIRSLKGWDARVNRKILGSGWYRKPMHERILFVAIPDWGKIRDNLHFHLAVSIPKRHQNFTEIASQAWKKLEPAGSAKIKGLVSKNDQIGWLYYITKCIDELDSYILSTEFIKD